MVLFYDLTGYSQMADSDFNKIILRRYLTFNRLLDTLKQGLFIPNASLFDDHWEAMTHHMAPYLHERETAIILQDETIPTLEGFCIPDIYRLVRNGMKEVYTSCWNGTDHECVAMWKLYGKGENAVMIETNAAELIATIEAFNQNNEWLTVIKDLIYILPGTDNIPDGHVPLWSNFKNIDPKQIQANYLFHQVFTGLQYKHKSYEFENEYRLLIAHKDRGKTTDGIILPFNKETFIKKVILQPSSSDEFKSVVETCLLEFGFGKTKIEKSIIDELPRYDSK
jgi:hypothetical protein